MQAVATTFPGQRSPRSNQCFGVWERLWARLHVGALDRALARGVPEQLSPALQWRAQVLTRPAVTHELALGLRLIVGQAHLHSRRLLRVHASPERLLAAEPELRRLASRLDAPRPSRPAGVAKVRLLLIDGTGPLYGGRAQELDAAVHDALSALA